MANEFITRNGLISLDNSQITGSLLVTGNVGIGTASPGTELAINSSNSFTRFFIQNAGSTKIELGHGPTGYGFTHPTGQFLAYADNLYFGQISSVSTNVTFTGGGSVGIGTTSPSEKLAVSNNIILGTSVSGPTSTPSYIDLGVNYSDSTLRSKLKIYLYNTGTEQYGFSVGPTSDVQYHSNGYHDFYIANSAKVRINNSGNVGIGTSSPESKLQIGSVGSTGYGVSNGLAFGDGTRAGAINVDGSGTTFYSSTNLILSPGTTEAIRITSGGLVGIGSTSPAYRLDVRTGNDDAIRIINSAGSNNNGLALAVGSGTPWIDFWGSQLDIKYNTSPGSWNSGANRFVTILSGGNVGIGTTSPGAKLHTYLADGANDNRLLIQQGSNGYAAAINLNGSNDAGSAYNYINSGTTGGTAMWQIGGGGVSNTMIMYTAGSERMRITSGGNVGIGTTSPLAILDVYQSGQPQLRVRGSAGANHLYQDATTGTTINDGLFVGIGSDQTGYVYHYESNALVFGTANTERMRIASGGSVGIGTTSPNAILSIVGSHSDNAVNIQNTNASSYSSIGFTNSSGTLKGAVGIGNASAASPFGGNFYIYTPSSTNIVAYLDGAERMRITSGGSVGIGTTSPTYLLNVVAGAGTQAIFQAGQSGVSNGYTINSNGTNLTHQWYNGGGEAMRLDTNGNVGIGNTSPTYKLHISSSNNNDGIAIHYPATSLQFPFYVGDNSNGVYAQLSAYEFEFKRNGGASTIKTVGSNNNLILQSANNLVFNTNGATERMRITDGGNVGIGTTSPGYLLDVWGGPGDVARFKSVNSAESLRAYLGSSYKIFQTSDNDQFGYYGTQFYITTNGGNERLRINNSGCVGIGTTSPITQLHIQSSGNEPGLALTSTATGGRTYRVFTNPAWATGSFQIYDTTSDNSVIHINSSGNVGINVGSNNPAYKLDVSGVGRFIQNTSEYSLIVDNYNGSVDQNYVSLRANGTQIGAINRPIGTNDIFLFSYYGNLVFGANTGGNATERMRITTGGNVGIGTTSPTTTLHVRTDTGVLIKGASSTTDAILSLIPASGGRQYDFRNYGSSFGIKDNSADVIRLFFHYDGNTGIGTTTPAAKLDILGPDGSVGTVRWANAGGRKAGFLYSDSVGVGIYDTNLADAGIYLAGNTQIDFRVNGSQRMLINSSGNVGIGTTSPIYLLDVYQSTNGAGVIQVRNPNTGGSAHAGLYMGNNSTTNAGGIVVFGSNYSGASPYNANGTYIYSNQSGGISIHAEGANPLALSTNSNIRLYINSGGNIGIGTTSPASKLEVVNSISSTTSTVTLFRNSYNNYDTNPTVTYPVLSISRDGKTGITYSSTAAFGISRYENSSVNARTQLDIKLGHGATSETDTTVMSLRSNGYIGIGTTTPDRTLTINGDTSILGNNYISTSKFFQWEGGAYWTTRVVSSGNQFEIYRGDTGTSVLVVSSGNNVGIGTTSPGYKLDVIGGAMVSDNIIGDPVYLRVQNNNTGGYPSSIAFSLYGYSTSAYFDMLRIQASYPGYGAANFIVKNQSNSSDVIAMTIKGDGNVGIGTTNPGYKLHIYDSSATNMISVQNSGGSGASTIGNDSSGNLYIKSPSNIYFQALSGTNSTIIGTAGQIILNSSSNTTFTGAGSVLVGSTSNDYGKLDVTVSPSAYTAALGLGLQTNSGEGNSVGISFKTKISLSAAIWENARIAVFTDAVSSSVYGALAFYTMNATTLSERMRIGNNGFVGIGTSSPDRLLVISATNPQMSIKSTTTTGFSELYFGDSAADLGWLGYAHNGDYMYFGVNGSERMRITSGGSVGIGTTDPSGYRLKVQTTGATGISIQTVGSDSGNPHIQMLNGAIDTTIAASSNGLELTAYSGHALLLKTSNTERMRITSGGSVGIGTTSPIGKLQVGSATFSGGNGVYDNSRVGVMLNGSLTSYIYTSTYNDASYPDYGFVFIHGPNTSNYNVWSISPDGPAKGSGLHFIYGANATNIHGNTPRVSFIGSTGNIGIGTTSPTSKLQVSGSNDVLNVRGSGSASTPSLFSVDGASGRLFDVTDTLSGSLFSVNTAAGLPVIEAFSDNTVRLGTFSAVSGSTVNITGSNVGVGTSVPVYKLDVVGTIRATADIIAYSDARVKENVETITDALTKVTSLRGVSYTRIDSEDKSRKVGVIAQEVLDILPEVVQQDDSGNYSVAYGNIVGVLIEAIKELKAEINELKNNK